MLKYRFGVRWRITGKESSAIILGDAKDDDEAIRALHVLVDYATLSGAQEIEVRLTGPGDRDVARIVDGDDVDREGRD